MDRVFTRMKAIVGARVFVATLTAAALLLGLTFNYINIKAKTSQNIPVVAHRGYSAAYPENSLSAFQGAADAGAQMMELDVQRTRDGKLVVFHDDDLERITGEHGAIKDYTYRQLCNLEIGSWFSEEFDGEPIPTLESALEIVAASHMTLILELKEIKNDDSFAQQAYDEVAQANLLDGVIFGSFKYDYLEELKNIDNMTQTMLFSRYPSAAMLSRCPADYYGINRKNLDRRSIRMIHKAGAQVYAYTVKSEKQMKKMKDMGVDGLICDDPLLGSEDLQMTASIE